MMTQQMMNELDKFFSEKTITDVDRNTYLVCNLKDAVNKITISLVFMRDWHSIESDSYNTVAVVSKGIVFTLPCYWVSIPRELAIEYITAIIEDFYTEELPTWPGFEHLKGSNNSDNNGNESGGNNGCPCPRN